MTVNNGITRIFMFLLGVSLDKRQRSQYNDVIIYDVISFMQIFRTVWAYNVMVYSYAKFLCDMLTNNEDTGGGISPLPQT